MRISVSVCASLLLCLHLSSCVTPVAAPRHAAAKRIGVLAVFGDKAHVQLSGFPVLLNKAGDWPAADFQVDGAACAAAVEALRVRNLGAEVVNLQAERASVHLARDPYVVLTSDYGGDRAKVLESTARRLAAEHSLDLVVLIVPWRHLHEENGGGPPRAAGYGIFTLSVFGLHQMDVHVYANYALGVFTGSTGKCVVFHPLEQQAEVGGIKWRESLEAYPAGERNALAAATRKMLTDYLPGELEQLASDRHP